MNKSESTKSVIKDARAVYSAIPKGYKQTEVGVIPEDWEVFGLGDVIVPRGLIRGPFGGSLKKEVFTEKGYKVYEQKNAISATIEKGDYFIDINKFKELERFQVQPGDYIVSCSGTIGCIFRIPEGSPEGVINQALLKITINNQIITHGFFILVFKSKSFQSKIKDNSHGGAMQNLVSMDVFRKTPISIPPTLAEQEAIAEALSDTDAYIESLEQLIQKKRLIKQGAMQELLTGKRRLPGFTGEWEVKRLGDVALFYKGKGLPKDDLDPNGAEKCIHYGELFTKYGAIIEDVISRTFCNNDTFCSIKNDVLMPTSDVTPNGLATASCIVYDDIVLGGDILVIRPDRTQLQGPYLSYCIRNSYNQVMQLVTGTTVYHLYPSNMKTFLIKIPTIKEQSAISSILSDMDSEISALEEKLKKARLIKQGMMQELLTGRIRLV